MSVYQYRPRFAIYADWNSNTSSAPLDQEIRRKFPNATIDMVTSRADLLKPSLYANLDAFILPGIQGEESKYPDHISPANDLIRTYVRGGGSYIGICAGAYYAAHSIQYRPGWGPHKTEDTNLLSLFSGTAYGPPKGLHMRGDTSAHFNGLRVTTLNTDIMGSMIKVPIVYSSGPTFLPGVAQQVTVHARYADADNHPPAIISFAYGRGLVLLTGPLPQYSGRPHSWLPEHQNLKPILDQLTVHEADRNRLFANLMRQVIAQSRRAGRYPHL
jgi:biotin--protein ligase